MEENKRLMSHEEFVEFIRDNYDMPRGWAKGKGQPKWHEKSARLWREMWRRCYDPKCSGYKHYINSIIHDDFRLFSNFLKWLQVQPLFKEFCSTCHEVRWELDKDMKVKNNVHYIPEYITLCTRSDNLKDRNNRRGNPLSNPKYHPKKPIIGISLNDNTIIYIKSTNEAKDFGFDKDCIRRCCIGKQKNHRGYIWKYLCINDWSDING